MKLIAKTKEGDIFEVKLQRQFPNCGKYKICCKNYAIFWDKLDAKVKSYKPEKGEVRRFDDEEYIKRFEQRIKPPKGFENHKPCEDSKEW